MVAYRRPIVVLNEDVPFAALSQRLQDITTDFLSKVEKSPRGFHNACVETRVFDNARVEIVLRAEAGKQCGERDASAPSSRKPSETLSSLDPRRLSDSSENLSTSYDSTDSCVDQEQNSDEEVDQNSDCEQDQDRNEGQGEDSPVGQQEQQGSDDEEYSSDHDHVAKSGVHTPRPESPSSSDQIDDMEIDAGDAASELSTPSDHTSPSELHQHPLNDAVSSRRRQAPTRSPVTTTTRTQTPSFGRGGLHTPPVTNIDNRTNVLSDNGPDYPPSALPFANPSLAFCKPIIGASWMSDTGREGSNTCDPDATIGNPLHSSDNGVDFGLFVSDDSSQTQDSETEFLAESSTSTTIAPTIEHEIAAKLAQFPSLADDWRSKLQRFFQDSEELPDMAVFGVLLKNVTIDSTAIVELPSFERVEQTLQAEGLMEFQKCRYIVMTSCNHDHISMLVVDTLRRVIYNCGSHAHLVEEVKHFDFFGLPAPRYDIVAHQPQPTRLSMQAFICLDLIHRIMTNRLEDWTVTHNDPRMSLLEVALRPCTLHSELDRLNCVKKRPQGLPAGTSSKKIRLEYCLSRLPALENDVDVDDFDELPKQKDLRLEIPRNVKEAFRKCAVDKAQLDMLEHAWRDEGYSSAKLADYSRFRILQTIMSVATPECVSIYLRQTAPLRSAAGTDETIHEMHRLVSNIQLLSKKKHTYCSQLRSMYIRLYSEHTSKLQRKAAELKSLRREQQRRGAAKRRADNGKKAADWINEEYRASFEVEDFENFKLYLRTGEVLHTLTQDGLKNSQALCLLPCGKVKCRMPITLTEQDAGRWIRTNTIDPSEYDNMKETHARFFAKWVLKLRPKLARLQSAPMSKLTNLIVHDGLMDSLEKWEGLPLDSEEFLRFISE